MRAAPAVLVSLNQFGAWRAAVFALALLAALAVLAWLAGQESLSGVRQAFAMVAAAGSLLLIGLPLANTPATELRWDGQCWALRTIRAADSEPVLGDMSVGVDLGFWMLLRFRPAESSRWTQPLWLPVQRRGIEPQWHALRCALFSPRMPAAPDEPAPR